MKMDYSIDICSFHTNYSELAKSIAFFRYDGDDTNSYYVKFYRSLGFANILDYTAAFPGWMLRDNLHGEMWYRGAKPHEYRSCVYDVAEHSRLPVSEIEADLMYIIEDDTQIFVTVTVEDVLSCSYTKDVSYENLWFCSDWKG